MSKNLEKNLKEMLQDLKEHQRSKSGLLPAYVTERLNKTVDVYYKTVLKSAESLSYRDAERVLKSAAKSSK